MGNIVPALFWLVPTTLGLISIVRQHEFTGIGVGLLILGVIVGWLGVNQFGLYQNARMRRRLLIVLSKGQDLPTEKFFVGYSSPRYSGIVDAHEDVGFLCLAKEALVFVSETRMVDIKRADISLIRFRSNVHSVLVLGRWISVEGFKSGVPVRLLVEPRERNTMLGNLMYGGKLRRRLEAWASSDV